MKPWTKTSIFAFLVAIIASWSYWDFQRGQEQNLSKSIQYRIFPEIEGSRLDTVIVKKRSFSKEKKIIKEEVIKEKNAFKQAIKQKDFRRSNQQILELQARDGQWEILHPPLGKGDATSIDTFLFKLLEQDIYRVKKEKNMPKKTPWGQYGFKGPTPSILFYLKTKEGKEFQIEVSQSPSFDGRYYLRKNNQLFIGQSLWRELIGINPNALRSKRLWPQELSIQSVRFTNHSGRAPKDTIIPKDPITPVKSFQILLQDSNNNNNNNKWKWKNHQGFEIDSLKVKSFVHNQIMEAQIIHFVEKNKAQLAKYNLKEPFGQLSITPYSHKHQSMDQDDTIHWMFTDPFQDKVFMVSSKKSGIYQVSPLLARQWLKTPNDFKKESKNAYSY